MWNKRKTFCETVSSSCIRNNCPNNLAKLLQSYLGKSLFLSTDNMHIAFYSFDFVLRNFALFFWDFNGSSSGKEDAQMLVMKYGEKMMENVRDSDQF